MGSGERARRRRSTRRRWSGSRCAMPSATPRPGRSSPATSSASCASGAGPGTDEPPVAAIVERMAALGYVDDRAFAAARGGDADPARPGRAAGRRGPAGRPGSTRTTRPRRGAAADDRPGRRRCAYAEKRRIGPFAPRPPTGRRAKRRSRRCCAPAIRLIWRAKSSAPRRARTSIRSIRERNGSQPANPC